MSAAKKRPVPKNAASNCESCVYFEYDEDYDADIRKGRFNPLKGWHDRPDYEAFCLETLELLVAEATESFEILPLEQDLDLLRNVLYSGVWQRYTLKTKQMRGKEDARGE